MLPIFHVQWLKLLVIIFFVKVLAERSRISERALEPDQDAFAGKEHCPKWLVLQSVLAKLGISEPTPHLGGRIIWNGCEVEGIKLARHKSINGTLDAAIGKLQTLRELDLADTEVSGDVMNLKGLTQLQELYLFNTNIRGDLSSLQRLTRLQKVNLRHTKVQGDMASLEGLTQLQGLSLSTTKVSGDLASVQGLTQLQRLFLYDTQIGGDVASLRGLVQLQHLWLHTSHITGDLASLRGFTQLKELHLYNTKISGDLGTLQNLTQVNELHLANTSVAGDFTALLPWNNVTAIDLEYTQVTGRLSSEWRGRWSKLRSLKLSNSQVEFLPRPDELQELQSSFFTSSYPEFSSNVILPQLNLLALNGCPLDGDVSDLLPPLCGCPALATIEAADCGLSGTLPSLRLKGAAVDGVAWPEWHSLLAQSLKLLNLGTNNITEIRDVTKEMQVLVLAENSALKFGDGVLKKALTTGTFLDLQNVALSNTAEAAELLKDGSIQKTEKVSSMSVEGGYECHSLVSSKLQVSPEKFLPQELCKCSPGFEGEGVQCRKCGPNTFSTGNRSKCTRCPWGSIAGEGAATCECTSGGRFLPDQVPACQCPAEYGLSANLEGPDGNNSQAETCLPCHKTHLSCPVSGMLLTSAPPEVGFARLRENDTAALPCLPPQDTRCNSTDSNGSTHFGCASGYGGVLCSDCEAQHYMTKSMCKPCPTTDFTQQIWSAAAVGGGIGLLGVGFVAFMWSRRTSGADSIPEMSSAISPFSATAAFKEQVTQLAPILLQVCQLWAVLATLMKSKAGSSDSWEVPFIEASQLSVDSLKGAMNLQCAFSNGAVRLASALVAPVAPVAVLLCCLSMEIFHHGFGVASALKALTLFYVGGASGASKLLRCQEVDGEKGSLPKEFAFRKSLPHLLCYDSSMTYLDAVGYSSIVFYGVVVPLCLAYLYARQHLALLPGKTTTAVALRDGDQWEIRLSELEGEKNFSPENLPANGELVHVKRLLAASAAHIAVKMQGCVRVTLKDGVVVAKPLSGDSGGSSSERVPEASRGRGSMQADWPLANISSFVEGMGMGMGNKSRDLTEALMDRCLLEEAESSERALAGAKHILFKYSRSQSLYMEIIQKLVAVALVSVVNSDDGLALCLAITILMAAASGMVQPYFHPQANSVQCYSFLCLALAAVGFSYEFTWLSRGSLAVPFLLSAALALRPDSMESLAVRIWRQMEKEISKLQDGKSLEIQVETVSFV